VLHTRYNALVVRTHVFDEAGSLPCRMSQPFVTSTKPRWLPRVPSTVQQWCAFVALQILLDYTLHADCACSAASWQLPHKLGMQCILCTTVGHHILHVCC
jgi:hypothetical protein